MLFLFFFFNDTATTEIYTLSLHDALPICPGQKGVACGIRVRLADIQEQAGLLPVAHQSRKLSPTPGDDRDRGTSRSEEHTSELQSRQYLVCRLLLEKKKNIKSATNNHITR